MSVIHWSKVKAEAEISKLNAKVEVDEKQIVQKNVEVDDDINEDNIWDNPVSIDAVAS